MKTIELSAAMASAPVQENLKNFAGLDAQNALGLMTPERLAAVAGEKMRFYAGDIFITSESFKDYIEIAKKITEVIDTQDRNISFSVTVRSGILFRVDGYLYQDKSHGLFLVYSYISGLEKKISLREGKFVEI